MQAKDSIAERALWFAWVVALTLAAIYLALVYRHAPAFPVHDDYHDSLQFILAYMDTEGLEALTRLFLSQHVEHRVILNHLLFAAYYELTGGLDYRQLILIANISVLALFLLYARLYRSPVLITLGALLLFNASFWNGSFWLIAAASNFSVVVLALLTLLLLQGTSPTRFGGAMLAALACCAAFGNGLAILLFGAASLWLQGQRGSRLGIWLLWSGLILFAYFYNYQQPEIIQQTFYRGSEQHAWQLILASPAEFTRWLLAVTGSGFSFGHLGVASLAGFALIAGWLYLCLQSEHRQQPVTILFTGFLLATLALAAYKRFMITFSDVDLPNRYSFYSIVLGVFLIAAITRHCQRRGVPSLPIPAIGVALLLACLFNGFAWSWGLQQAQGMFKPLQNNLLNWMQRGDQRLFVMFADNPVESLKQAMAREIYSPYDAIPTGHRGLSQPAEGTCGPGQPNIDPPESALLVRLDRKALQQPAGNETQICLSGRPYLIRFDKLPTYLPL
jgi:hypothetical protein